MKNPIGNNLPRTYVACLNPDFPGARPSRAWVKQQEGWTWIEMQTGHLPMVTHPEELTSVLIKIAAA